MNNTPPPSYGYSNMTKKHTFHPMRRDLWTDPAVSTDPSNLDSWKDYLLHHPLYKQGVNVDQVSGISKRPLNFVSNSAVNKYVGQVGVDWAGAGAMKHGKNRKGLKGKKATRSNKSNEEEGITCWTEGLCG